MKMLTVINPRGEATIMSEEQKSLYNFMLLLQKEHNEIILQMENGKKERMYLTGKPMIHIDELSKTK